MKIIGRKSFRNIYIVLFFIVIGYFLFKKTDILSFDDANYNGWSLDKIENDRILKNIKDNAFPDSKAVPNDKKVQWRDLRFEALEASRNGPGEQGVPASLTGFDEKEKQDIWDTNGFNGLLSDSIPLERALKDIRDPKCPHIKYNPVLPTVSVVIPFFEEHWTALLRTVVSVVNRSPPEVLKEIILVDDGSTMKSFLKEPLDHWLAKNQPKAKVIRLPERVGLIIARQEGAKAATGDVIVVLDSHCEVMTGWLPPLLEPIVNDYRTAVCPFIDVINAENFAYTPQDAGGRGAFDWRFYYKRLPLKDTDLQKLPEPFENPVMNGGLFAISRQFFWELGGYDTGLKIWGGEQYDLSFKIWQCGGRLLDSPCSRVGHIFRQGGKKRPAAKNAGDFLSKNYKRVAVVWMDEYAEALYRRNPRLRTVDEGDVSAEIDVRKRLGCKPFKWFLDEVAPDLEKMYPAIEPPDYANGTIKSEVMPSQCVDTGSQERGNLIVYGCHGLGPQYFALGWKKTIKVESEQFCWVAPHSAGQPPSINNCQTRNIPSTYRWRYDPVTKQIQEEAYKRCLEINPSAHSLSMEKCDLQKQAQRWLFKTVNKELIEKEFPPFS